MRLLRLSLSAMFAATAITATLSGCGPSKEEQAIKQAQDAAAKAGAQMEKMAKDMEAANKKGEAARASGDKAGEMAAAQDAMKAVMGGGTDALVDFRELQGAVPEELLGLKRTAREGSKGGFMGMGASTARSVFEDEKKTKRFEIEISDIGGLGGLAGAAFSWANVDIDKENEQGYERTIKLGNRKGMEKYQKANKSGELNVIVSSRYVVSVKARGVDAKELKDAIEKIDLAKLEAIKPPAPATTASK